MTDVCRQTIGPEGPRDRLRNARRQPVHRQGTRSGHVCADRNFRCRPQICSGPVQHVQPGDWDSSHPYHIPMARRRVTVPSLATGRSRGQCGKDVSFLCSVAIPVIHYTPCSCAICTVFRLHRLSAADRLGEDRVHTRTRGAGFPEMWMASRFYRNSSAALSLKVWGPAVPFGGAVPEARARRPAFRLARREPSAEAQVTCSWVARV